MTETIQPGPSFKDNLVLLPSIDGLARIDIVAGDGRVAASIEIGRAHV